MSKKRLNRVVPLPIWGIILLFLGVVFLLQTLNIVPWGIWGSLWRFWPALIIIAGLGILLGRYNVWLVSLLILAILGGSFGIAIWQYGPATPSGVAARSYTEPLGDIERAEIVIDFSAGSIVIGYLPSASPNFVEADSELRNGHETMAVDFKRQDGEGKLTLSTINQPFWGEGGVRWQVNLTRNIPLTINIKSAASNMELDLNQLKVTGLRLDIDAGNCKVIMPSSAGDSDMDVKADAANVEITIPVGVAAKIKAEVNLGVFDTDTSRFPRQDGYYASPDFETATNRIDMKIESNVGRIIVY